MIGASLLFGPLAYRLRTLTPGDGTTGPSKYQKPWAMPRTYVGMPVESNSKQCVASSR